MMGQTRCHPRAKELCARALRFREFGGPEKLQVEDVPDSATSAGELVVQIRAASLNPSDVKNVQGKMEGTTLPRTPGRDFAGIVIEGPKELINEEVWGTGGDIGFSRDGSHAERIAVPVTGVSRKPDSLSFEEAATVGVNFLAAWIGLIDTAHLGSGETILATGAGGGVGSAVLQIAKWKDANSKTIAVDVKPISPERQKEFGIDHFILATADDGYKSMIDDVQRITGSRVVNIAYDCVGGPLFEPCLKPLRRGGRQVNITSVGDRRVSFDLLDFYHRRLSLFGVDTRAYDTRASAAILDKLTPGFQSGALKSIPITERLHLDDARDAYTRVNQGEVRGKAVFIFE